MIERQNARIKRVFNVLIQSHTRRLYLFFRHSLTHPLDRPKDPPLARFNPLYVTLLISHGGRQRITRHGISFRTQWDCNVRHDSPKPLLEAFGPRDDTA
jgi:hypothetical protein